MPTTAVTADLRVSFTVHDAWTESYVGTRHLIYTVLPDPGVKMSPETRTLCQLALIGSNHLMEVALFRLLTPYAIASGPLAKLTESLLAEASYFNMLTRWAPAVTGKTIDMKKEPFASTDRLRKRRNETVHKSSAIANVPMARSALYSATEGVKALYKHFGNAFPYEKVLQTWALPDERMFSAVTFPK